jgi:hypothetical protein
LLDARHKTGLATWVKAQKAGFDNRGCWARSACADTGTSSIEGPRQWLRHERLQRRRLATHVRDRRGAWKLCKDCRRLLAEKEQLADENRWLLAQVRDEALDEAQLPQKLLSENEHLTEEISGLLYTTRKQAASIAALTRELRKTHADDPTATEIEIVLANWKHHTGHPKAKTPVGGKRWVVVKKALKDHTLEELLEAIEGLGLVPYVGNHGRKTDGKPSERYDDVEHALRDETTIARFRSYRARALKASSSVLLDVYAAVGATETLYASAVLSALAREEDAKRVKDAEYNGYVRRLVDGGQAAASRNGDTA